MVLMDMPVIDPLLRAAGRLLAPGGRFVFAVLHPAFNSNAVRLCAETETRGDGLEVTTHAVKVTDYLAVPAGKGTGMPGEPEPHWYFHRPLHELFGAFFQAGFVLDALEEPALVTRNLKSARALVEQPARHPARPRGTLRAAPGESRRGLSQRRHRGSCLLVKPVASHPETDYPSA